MKTQAFTGTALPSLRTMKLAAPIRQQMCSTLRQRHACTAALPGPSEGRSMFRDTDVFTHSSLSVPGATNLISISDSFIEREVKAYASAGSLSTVDFENFVDLDELVESKPETVPEEGEVGALMRFWLAYSSALETHPILVKSATSFFGFLIGDLLAQTIGGHGYDAFRTMRLVLFGMFMDGPVGHVWYTTLDKHVMPEDPKSNLAVVIKTGLDQLLWAPVFSCVFFTFIKTLEGHPENIVPAITAKLLPLLLANYAVWPLAHLVNFKFIPSKQRILYINCCQILWSAYLSHLTAAGGHHSHRF